MKTKNWSLLAMFFSVFLVLAACSGNDDASSDSTDEGEKLDATTSTAKESLSLEAKNDGDAINGGTLKVAMMKDEPFQGILLAELYEDAYDSDLMSWASNSLFEVDGEFLITNEGIASLDVDEENNKAIVKIREGVKWSDGEPLKIEDLILPYEIIADKDYKGVRYDGDLKKYCGY